MSQHATSHPTDAPVRYGSRYRSEPPTARSEPRCLVCTTSLPARRARYCSDACKQRAYRLRRIDVTATDAALLATELKRLGELVAHTIYECPDCGERFMAEQRCPDCHRFCRKLGLGGCCPDCQQPVLLVELLGQTATQ
jgi:hypothetical protein